MKNGLSNLVSSSLLVPHFGDEPLFPSLFHYGQENRKCESGTVLGLVLEPGKDRMERVGLGKPLLPALPDS